MRRAQMESQIKKLCRGNTPPAAPAVAAAAGGAVFGGTLWCLAAALAIARQQVGLWFLLCLCFSGNWCFMWTLLQL